MISIIESHPNVSQIKAISLICAYDILKLGMWHLNNCVGGRGGLQGGRSIQIFKNLK